MKSVSELNSIGAIGLFITAIASPCCFPLFGFILAALGFGTFELFGGWTMWVIQGLVMVSVAGLFLSYRKHRCGYPLIVAIPSAILIFYSYHFLENSYWIYILYIGMTGLFIAAGINYYRNKLHNTCCNSEAPNDKVLNLNSIITCPECSFSKEEQMPVDACQYYYDCDKCRQVLKPKPGNCCVYCSYGTVKCPPMQTGFGCY